MMEMQNTIGDDILNLENLRDRFEELKALKDSLCDSGELLDDELEELELLTELFEQTNLLFGSTTLIRDEYFEEFARQEADGMYGNLDGWPFDHIDWETAAKELQADYLVVDIGEHTYWLER
jgi:hypothetical protein